MVEIVLGVDGAFGPAGEHGPGDVGVEPVAEQEHAGAARVRGGVVGELPRELRARGIGDGERGSPRDVARQARATGDRGNDDDGGYNGERAEAARGRQAARHGAWFSRGGTGG